MDILNEVEKAAQRIRPYTLTTPLLFSHELSKIVEGKVYLKLESEQHTGSFKARGSMNKILSLNAAERQKGVVTASTGNHALGCARALMQTGTTGTIYLPTTAAKAKVAAIRNYGATVEFYGTNPLNTELYAKAQAKKEGKIWISPYNDPQIMGGQGTIAVELCQQLPHFDSVLVTVGGGGLIGGVGTYLKAKRPATTIIGCLPENSPEMQLSLEKGEVVVIEEGLETLSDGSAGGLETDSITFPVAQKVIDECLLVSEKEIAGGLRFMVHTHRKIIEGSAAVTIASLIRYKEQFKGKTVVLIICGGNIDIQKLKKYI